MINSNYVVNDRPECATKGCTNRVHNTGTYDSNGRLRYRMICGTCHAKRIRKKDKNPATLSSFFSS